MTTKILPLAYIASPYSHMDSSVRVQRYWMVCQVTKQLAKEGNYAVYSPIAMWHPIALALGLPTNAIFWKHQNEGILKASKVLIVVKMDGWEQSTGVQMEIAFAKEHKIEIIFMDF